MVRRLNELKNYTLKSIETELNNKSINEKNSKFENYLLKNEKKMRLSNFNIQNSGEVKFPHSHRTVSNPFINSISNPQLNKYLKNPYSEKKPFKLKKVNFDFKATKSRNKEDQKQSKTDFNLNLKYFKNMIYDTSHDEKTKMEDEITLSNQRILTIDAQENIEIPSKHKFVKTSPDLIQVFNTGRSEDGDFYNDFDFNQSLSFYQSNYEKRKKKNNEKLSKINNRNEYFINTDLALHAHANEKKNHFKNNDIKQLFFNQNKDISNYNYEDLFNFFPLKTFGFSDMSNTNNRFTNLTFNKDKKILTVKNTHIIRSRNNRKIESKSSPRDFNFIVLPQNSTKAFEKTTQTVQEHTR